MTLELSLETIKSQIVKNAECIASFTASSMHLSNAAAHVNALVEEDQKKLGFFTWSTVVEHEITQVIRNKSPKAIISKGNYTWFLLAREESDGSILITIARIEYSYE